ncbi:unnamed protein product [Clavelina lepadiformis]|uniref:Enoyl reductase (ER) domain-containing protein n=1 Tax=Clavelina lepadiformis TaxID=159417 RepID=A0ABP0GEQ0_CLALP
MKRAQIVKPYEPLVVDTVAIPEPPPKGVVVKTSYSGVCHTDLHQWDNEISEGSNLVQFIDNPDYKLPVVPGHEMSGIVHSVGSQQDQGDDPLKVGDRVALYPWIGCGKCGFCNNGDSNICAKNLWLGFMLPGGYASYIIVPESKFAVKLPDSIPLDVACMFSCSGLTTYSAVVTARPAVEKAIVRKGKANLLIIGAGGLGLWSTQIAKHLFKVSTIITVADVNEEKLKVARERGAHETVCWDPSVSDGNAIQEAMKIGGYDAIIDYVNTTKTTNRAFHCLGMGGLLVMVGLFGGQAQYSLPKMVFCGKGVQGVIVGTLQSMKDMIKLVADEKLISPPMKYLKLEDVTETLKILREGKMTGRGVIDFNL